ncbi:zonular occludens toxin domain-containing protein [Acinetobacter junii]|uniref:zonular occludens toxin domain-containing protein n=1 Tax=Acinetobacter junii TaxID=40215 RepID=UPI003213B667
MSELAGGIFRLVCGQIGAGKSYLLVKLTEEEAKKSGKYQKIYSNIRGHSELTDGVYDIPDDWRDCETDSLLIIDEVQMHEKFSKHFSNRRDSEIAELTMIRHKRIDLWLISPSPTLVNKDVRDLVTQYYYLEPTGKKTTKCYCFTKVVINVTKSTKQQAYDEFMYAIEEKYYKLYKSTADGKPSGRNHNFNWKLLGFIAGMVVVVIIICLLVAFLANNTKKQADNMSQTQTNQSTQQPKKNENDKFGVMPALSDEECRKGVNVDKPECVAYFNKLTQTGASVGVAYNPSKPYDDKEIQQNLTYDVTAKPVFSGCMKTGNKYQAYTQQGTKLDVSQADCERLIRDNDRPFNYFATNQQATPSMSNQSITSLDQANQKTIDNSSL